MAYNSKQWLNANNGTYGKIADIMLIMADNGW